MAEYLVKDTSLTAIADEIRTLSGTTSPMGLDAMASTLNTENTNFSTNLSAQDSLISQIQAALQNKASALEPVLQTKTVTPTTSSQNVVADSGYDGLSQVTVNAIPSTYVKPSVTKAATTYTPTTSNQTIAAGTYCSGVQTIKGDANLKAENIAEGVSIFGVTGTHSGGGSGGGSVETTTVTINGTANRVYLTVYENGEITAKTGLVGILGNTLTNVVRGSIMVVRSQTGAVSVQNATQINALTFTTENGEEERLVAFSVN